MRGEIIKAFELKKHEVGNRYLTIIGLCALFLYAFTWLLYLPFSKAAETILVIISLYVFFRKSPDYLSIIRNPVGLIFILWLFLLVSNFVVNIEYYVDHLPQQFDEARHYTKIFLFFICAWWMSGSSQIIFFTLFAATLGFIFGTVFNDHDFIHEYELFKRGGRIALGYKNAEHLSVYASFTLFFFIVFYKRIIALIPKYQWLAFLIINISGLLF